MALAKKIASNLSSPGELIEAVSLALKAEGASEDRYDFAKVSERKMANLETKANELVHTGNTGAGAELIPGAIQTTDFLDLAPTIFPTLEMFKGFHGRNMDKTMEVPIIGEIGLHNLEAESTGDTLTNVNASTGTLATAKCTIAQKKLAFRVTVSDEEVRFSNVIDIVAALQKKLADSSARTTVSALINGDTVLTANTNINLIDGTPTGTEHYLVGDGLRKSAFSDSTATDGGTLAFADFITAMNSLGENTTGDLFWLFGTYSHNLALTINEFSQQYINGAFSTVRTGKVPSFLGYDVAVERYLNKSNTAGKISATGANNAKGSVILADKYAMQWGYNGDYSIELVRVPAKGWQLVGYYYLGLTSASGKAGTDKRISMLYNLS
jgi:hypothetical protein